MARTSRWTTTAWTGTTRAPRTTGDRAAALVIPLAGLLAEPAGATRHAEVDGAMIALDHGLALAMPISGSSSRPHESRRLRGRERFDRARRRNAPAASGPVEIAARDHDPRGGPAVHRPRERTRPSTREPSRRSRGSPTITSSTSRRCSATPSRCPSRSRRSASRIARACASVCGERLGAGHADPCRRRCRSATGRPARLSGSTPNPRTSRLRARSLAPAPRARSPTT